VISCFAIGNGVRTIHPSRLQGGAKLDYKGVKVKKLVNHELGVGGWEYLITKKREIGGNDTQQRGGRKGRVRGKKEQFCLKAHLSGDGCRVGGRKWMAHKLGRTKTASRVVDGGRTVTSLGDRTLRSQEEGVSEE